MKAYSVSIGHHQSSSKSGTFDGIRKFSDGKHPEKVESEIDTLVFEGQAAAVGSQLCESGEAKREEKQESRKRR